MTRSNLVSILLVCTLPAIAVDVRTPHGSFLATFFYACPEPEPAPRVRANYTAADRPKPRSATAPVQVFEHGHAPARRYQIVGQVSVLASSARTGSDVLTDWAGRSARKMGGDAIVDVTLTDAASARPKAGDVGLLYLTASVARWE